MSIIDPALVPRPLFIEEYGLRLLLEAKGVGVELSHHDYESGNWIVAIERAFELKRRSFDSKKETDMSPTVKYLLDWLNNW